MHYSLVKPEQRQVVLDNLYLQNTRSADKLISELDAFQYNLEQEMVLSMALKLGGYSGRDEEGVGRKQTL